MTTKNTVYTVTPPDLRINMIGPSVLLLGTDLEHCQDYTQLYDKLFPEVEITFFVGEEGFNPGLAHWYRATAGMASNIFVNLDNITAEEIFLAMQAEHENRALVFWVAKDKTYPAMVSLLNSYQYQVFNSLDEVEKFMLDEFNKS